MQPRNQVLSEAERLGGREGSNGVAARVRRRRSGGVFDLGMFATDGPVTWEIPTFPRATPVDREPVTSPCWGAIAQRTRRWRCRAR